ncbi:MAG: hypothetical protein ACJ75P_12835 [Gaiellaceae bacterium]
MNVGGTSRLGAQIRIVVGYIDATIEYERGTSKEAPPGGYAKRLDKAEADLVYLTVRRTLAALGLPVNPEWFPPNDYHAQRLDNAYARRGLDPTPLDR